MLSVIIILGVAIFVAVLVGGIVWAVREDMKSERGEAKDGAKSNLEEFNKERAKKRQANKQKILDFVNEKGQIRNNDVEGLIGVSDAEAERYMDELEKEGKVRQAGKSGQYVHYKKV